MKHLFEAKRRPKSLGGVLGFVVEFSDLLILLHQLVWDTFRLNGYIAIRTADVSAFRFFDRLTYWQHRAAAQLGLTPRRPQGVSIASLGDLLTSASRKYPLINIHTERTRPDVCFIGELSDITDRTATIEDLDCNGEWSGPRRIRLPDITRVEFGGGYEHALAVTAPKRRRTKDAS